MSGPLYLLDTNILLLLVRGGERSKRIDEEYRLRDSDTRPLISIVTHGEIFVIAARNHWGARRQEALKQALGELVTVDVNHRQVIDAYVEIDVYSQNHIDGARNMGKNDLWIAACAKAADATLLTTDKDFEHHSTVVSISSRMAMVGLSTAASRPNA